MKLKKLPPKPIGIAKTRGDPLIVNLRSQSIGNSYGEALSQGLPLLKPSRLNLSANGLNPNTSAKIVLNLDFSRL